ncbi:hypothetical protein CYMTET_56165 [Cymbomonas tetramitiformis]|uniref:Uncharacterized protein n=1 Tax=Cymbomonas tetramitiformis TaxID=36881 RepID=A0AAE0BCQ3_9CHLO|nr:hypothetical protein CYMTET_56165 [Cymbomonas tetramitiformis]
MAQREKAAVKIQSRARGMAVRQRLPEDQLAMALDKVPMDTDLGESQVVDELKMKLQDTFEAQATAREELWAYETILGMKPGEEIEPMWLLARQARAMDTASNAQTSPSAGQISRWTERPKEKAEDDIDIWDEQWINAAALEIQRHTTGHLERKWTRLERLRQAEERAASRVEALIWRCSSEQDPELLSLIDDLTNYRSHRLLETQVAASDLANFLEKPV